MLENIKSQNSIVRTIKTAGIAFSIVTIISGAIAGIVNPKDKFASQLGVYASLISAGCGAVFGLAIGDKSKKKNSQTDINQTEEARTLSSNWQDWRNFVVVRKVKESEEITSFYLEPEKRGEIPNFHPGQFLTIKLNIPGRDRPVIRTYSLSDYNTTNRYYRLSIKREPMPANLDVPAGIASNFMHDRIFARDVIAAKPPSGNFILDVSCSLPAVLISNGVGITPMLSMAKACSLLNRDRSIWFIHGARDGRFHAFRDEVMAIAQQNPNLHVHYRYSRPRPEDEGYYHSQGYVDTALIQQLVVEPAEYFLCGSPSFMQSLIAGLKASGVPESRILFESFTKATKDSSAIQFPTPTDREGLKEAEIVFAKSGKTITWQTDNGTILEFAEANEIYPPFSCRAGICGTCICQIQAGEVVYQEPPTATIDEGSVLICISQPRTAKVVLNL